MMNNKHKNGNGKQQSHKPKTTTTARYALQLSPEKRFELIVMLASGLAAGSGEEAFGGGHKSFLLEARDMIDDFLEARGRFLARRDGVEEGSLSSGFWRPHMCGSG